MKALVSLFLGVALAATPAFAGSIQWSGPQNIEMGPEGPNPDWGGFGDVYIDYDDDGAVDCYIQGELDVFVYPQPGPDGLMNEITAEQRVTRPLCWPLDPGTELGPVLPGNIIWHPEGEALIEWRWYSGGVAGLGTWAGVSNRYIGVRFDTGAGNIHYGWVQMTVYDEYMGSIVYDWAWNTIPGEPILAGDTGIHYVSPNGSSQIPFSSWATAATNIQTAVNASGDGGAVIITNGVFVLSSEVSVTNGVTIRGVAGAGSTTVDGGYPLCTNRCFHLAHPDAVISDLTVANGHAPGTNGHGGGVLSETGGTVVRCILTGSVAESGGGAAFMSGGQFRNCLVVGNGATNAGGVYMSGVGVVVHSTIASNSAEAAGGLLLRDGVAVINSVIYGNQAASNGPNWYVEGPGATFTHVCSIPRPVGSGNTDADPLFVDPSAGDYRLLVASPCIDTGTNMPAVAMDIAGVPRPLDGDADLTAKWDMGAYEYTSALADTDSDGLTDAHEVDVIGTSPADSDTDDDLMPDGWEVENSLNPLTDDAALDPDADTMNNGREYESDTNPQAPGSVLALLGIRAQAGGVRVDWKGGEQALQFLERRSDLASTTDQWTAIFAIPPTTPITNSVIDMSTTNRPVFYRIRAER